MGYSNSIFRASWASLLSRTSTLLAGISLAIGATLSTPAANAEPTQVPFDLQLQAAATAPLPSLPDGVYLYGQSEKPEQLGQGYFVFEVTSGNVVGALYMPRSSFDCAKGSFNEDQIALTVVNSYDRSSNPFQIALERVSNVASIGNPVLEKVGLQGFHKLAELSENDQRMLSVCKADFKQSK